MHISISIDWDCWTSLAREIAGYLPLLSGMLHRWADRMDERLESQFLAGAQQVETVELAVIREDSAEWSNAFLREGRKLDDVRRRSMLDAFRAANQTTL